MKCLFAVDHIFGKGPDENIYTIGGKFPYAAWATYLETFGSLTVLSRCKELGETENLAISNGEDVSFRLLPAERGTSRIRNLRSTKELIRRAVQDAEVVIARVPSETALLAVKYAKLYKKPYLVEVVACPWDALWYHGSIFAKAYAVIGTARNKNAIFNAPIVRYVSREFLQLRYPTKGISFSASNVLLEPSIPPERSFRFDSNVKLGTIGALHTKLKGIHNAIEAIAEIKTLLPELDIKYEIVGEGECHDLRKMAEDFGISEHVDFIGTLPPGKEIANWLDTIDIYLQPSFQEGLPRALIEALSRGCIAIGSTAGGIPELLSEERLHKPGNAAQLSQIILKVVSCSQSTLSNESQHNKSTSKFFSYDVVKNARLKSLETLKSLSGTK